ncbi:hypothetical protein IWZ01DRAFT_555189 [Phyllosticta capitalensis]
MSRTSKKDKTGCWLQPRRISSFEHQESANDLADRLGQGIAIKGQHTDCGQYSGRWWLRECVFGRADRGFGLRHDVLPVSRLASNSKSDLTITRHGSRRSRRRTLVRCLSPSPSKQEKNISFKVAPPGPPHRKPHARKTLLRSLFPQLRQRARQHLFSLRHETLPSLRHSAQARIWRYIVRRQQLAAARQNSSSRTKKLDSSSSRILALLRKTYGRVLAGGPRKKHALPRPTQPPNDNSMSTLGAGRFYTANPYDEDAGGEGGLRADGSREPGARRRKLAGYLKAANELRQAYQSTYTNGWRGGDKGDWMDADDTPGAFPDATIVRSGEEEMVLFPSYARTHVRRKRAPPPDTSGNDAEYWKQEFERHEDDNAIVDVDVRGWIYYPHKGQMNRKHRLFVGVARQLVGLPNAPGKSSKPNSRSPSPHASERASLQDRNDKREEEFVEQEALDIVKKGEKEASYAGRGSYSENPSRTSDMDSLYSVRSREPSPIRRRTNDTWMDEEPVITSLQKRDSWKEPQKMNAAELAMANTHLMSRLKPFLAMPLASTPISIFFYNDKISRQRTIYTDAAGHFTTRAALDFVPTHIRIMVSESLSTTAEIHVTEPKGISVISDIDDTIKHSAISAGAREIFRNAFIRELGDLTIEGVKEWYGALYEKGVKFHYVSNSPWQIYPVISQFFKMAGLPPGSFHLKQYSGMLQGIFEPVAERKKATLERLARDFPQRSFILVGDSGEADLEVYTDFVLDNPGRVLGVFIRDVTTKPHKGFFDPSISPAGSKTPKRRPKMSRRSTRSSAASEDDPDLRAAIQASLRDLEKSQSLERQAVWSPGHSPGSSVGDAVDMRPPLPRRPTDPPAVEAHRMDPPIGNLIEFSDDEDTVSSGRTTPLSRTPTDLEPIAEAPLHRRNAVRGRTTPTIGHRLAPPPPKKPLKLRSTSQDSTLQTSERRPSTASSMGKSPPPIRRPSTSVKTSNLPRSRSPLAQSPQVPESPEEKKQNTPPAPPPRRTGTSTGTGDSGNTSYLAMATNKVSQAYNSLPQASAIWEGSGQKPSEARSASASSTLPGNPDGVKKAPPPPPPRRTTSPSPADVGKEGIVRSPTFPTSAPNNVRFYDANSSQRPATANASSSSLNLKPPQVTSALPTSAPGSATPVGNKREELWRKRWTKAEQILNENGVLLRSWRVGDDVMDESMQLIDEALRKQQLLERSDSKGNALKLHRARAFRED